MFFQQNQSYNCCLSIWSDFFLKKNNIITNPECFFPAQTFYKLIENEAIFLCMYFYVYTRVSDQMISYQWKKFNEKKTRNTSNCMPNLFGTNLNWALFSRNKSFMLKR